MCVPKIGCLSHPEISEYSIRETCVSEKIPCDPMWTVDFTDRKGPHGKKVAFLGTVSEKV